MKYRHLLTLLFASAISIHLSAQVKKQSAPPARKAWMGANGKFSSSGMAVDTVMRSGTFHSLGIHKGDTVLQINKVAITDAATYNSLVGGMRTGDKIGIQYRRNNKLTAKQGKALMRPYDTDPATDILYGWVTMDSCQLRTIVRKPKTTGKVPSILLIPGYNCGSVENYNQGNYSKLIRTWLNAGFAVITIEKSGLGDSYNCISCNEADLATDIRSFNAGYQYMESLPFVDTANLFIWGHSMGGVIAPIVAQQHHPRGVIAFATVYRPWSEFLLEMQRVQLPLAGSTYAATEDRIRLIQKIYYEFFRLKKTPAELYQNPEYRDMVVTELEYKPGSNDMWGRHWRFWQQLDSIDLARSWDAVNAKVLSLFGGADFIACSELEHQLLTRTVNASHPGNATHIRIPDVDHLITYNDDRESAQKHFPDTAYRNTHFHQGLADTTVKWMRSVMSSH
jgi:uncharacterized protein